MLLGVIPSEFEDELLAKPHIKTWQDIISWCKVKTVYKRQKVLAEAARRPGGRINSLQFGDEEEEDAKKDAVTSEPEEPPQWFMEYVNRLSGSNGTQKPPPPPKPLTGRDAQRERGSPGSS